VGSARVVKAPPDGYQFVLGSRADAINQTLYKNPLYNFATDLAPVVLIADHTPAGLVSPRGSWVFCAPVPNPLSKHGKIMTSHDNEGR
jgi:hypothetical protein